MISHRFMVDALNSTASRRITAVAAPGSLLKRPVQPRGVREAAGQDVDAAYLRDIRECPCLMCGLDPCGEAAHVRFASAAHGKSSGLGKRPEHKWALPVCGSDHRVARHAQHNRNEQEFWDALGINPLITAQRLYAQRGDMVAMRAVVMVTIAERSASIARSIADQMAPPPSLSIPDTTASPASPPRQALPPRPSIEPESGGDVSQ